MPGQRSDEGSAIPATIRAFRRRGVAYRDFHGGGQRCAAHAVPGIEQGRVGAFGGEEIGSILPVGSGGQVQFAARVAGGRRGVGGIDDGPDPRHPVGVGHLGPEGGGGGAGQGVVADGIGDLRGIEGVVRARTDVCYLGHGAVAGVVARAVAVVVEPGGLGTHAAHGGIEGLLHGVARKNPGPEVVRKGDRPLELGFFIVCCAGDDDAAGHREVVEERAAIAGVDDDDEFAVNLGLQGVEPGGQVGRGQDLRTVQAEGIRAAVIAEVEHDIARGQAVQPLRGPGLERILQIGFRAIRIHIIRHPVGIQVQVRIRGEVVDGLFGKGLARQGGIGVVRGGLGRRPEAVARIGPAPRHDDRLSVLRQENRVELLDPVVVPVRDVDVAGGIHRDPVGAAELAGAAAPVAPLEEENTVPVELLGSGVAGAFKEYLRDIDIARGIHCNSGGIVKLAVACAVAAPCQDEIAIGIELLYAVVVSIRYVYVGHVRDGIEGRRDSTGGEELTFVRAVTAPFDDEIAIGIEFLYAVVPSIHYIDFAGSIHRNSLGAVELGVTGAVTAPFDDEISVGIELLYAVVAAISNVHVARGICRDTLRVAELAVTGAVTAPFDDEIAVGVELLDAVVAPFGDMDVAGTTNLDAVGVEEFTVAATCAAPFVEETAVGIELLDAVVAPIDNVNVARSVRGKAGGIAKLTVSAPVGAPFVKETAVGVELLDAEVPGIRHIHVARGVHVDALRAVELLVAGARSAPFDDEIAVGVELLDAIVVCVSHVDVA